ncbi:DUF4302 domain-containing protein [Sphingobacterium bambusae]|uniref:DUF4302 domain-containing protein n=1 Tax=Sphingobacterium bambusae TaxID=662858 RepID=A0ABW6BFP7_9SPHI|nr:DUF4302 domain-containing protein [Sphingobacterium bambusae]WPL47162.1 DUF4302 domain-containing protein [Sphingobacterium bambusae]
MKFRYILLALLLPVFVFNSCKRETDRIFEENATVRVNEAIRETYEVLQSNKGGWMMKFYPSDNQEFGGYTIFTKFLSNAQVSIASDPIAGVQTSSYSVVQESGPVLTFDGYNKSIHWFSEPGMDNGGIGADDTGMKGDFEFIVLKATADSVVLKGKKSGSRILMQPLEEGQFESLSSEYQDAANSFIEFGVFKLEDASGEIHPLVYDSKMRVFQNTKENSGELLSFRVVPGGLEFFKTYVIDGVSFDNLAFREPTDDYPYGYYTDNANTFKIMPDVTPLNTWFMSNLWGMRYSGLGAEGQSWWDAGRTRFTNNNYTLNYVYLGHVTQGRRGFYVDLTVGGQNSTAYFIYNMTPVPGTVDEVTLSFGGSYYSSAAFQLTYWNNAIIYLVQMLNSKTFKITSDVLEKPSKILLTDKADPDNTIVLELEDFSNPLVN